MMKNILSLGKKKSKQTDCCIFECINWYFGDFWSDFNFFSHVGLQAWRGFKIKGGREEKTCFLGEFMKALLVLKLNNVWSSKILYCVLNSHDNSLFKILQSTQVNELDTVSII